MGLDPNDPICHALQDHFGNNRNVLSLLTMSPEDIDTLEYWDTSYNPHQYCPVPRGSLGLLRILIRFHTYRHEINQPIDKFQWTSITQEDFDDFRTGPYMAQVTTKTLPSADPSPYAKSPLETFRYGIRRDMAAYPIFKLDNEFDSWYRTFESVGISHALHHLFDFTYEPVGSDAIELFQEQQNFLYAVLCFKAQTNKGKALVREQQLTRDARAVLSGLQEFHRRSYKATTETSAILTYLSSVRLGPGSTWRGTTHDFVLHWVNQVRLYDANSPPGERLSQSMKLALLKNCVEPIEEFRAINVTNNLLSQQPGSLGLTFETYYSLLIGACQAYDSSRSTNPGASNLARRRNVLTHAFSHHSGASIDIDTPISLLTDPGPELDNDPFVTLEAFATGVQGRPGRHRTDNRPDGLIRMPVSRWKRLPDDAKALWDSLDEKYKAIILGVPEPGSTGPSRPPSERRVNFSTLDLTPEEDDHLVTMLEYLHHHRGPPPDSGSTAPFTALSTITAATTAVVPAPQPPAPDGSLRLAQTLQSGPRLAAGDLRRMLSNSYSASVCYPYQPVPPNLVLLQ